MARKKDDEKLLEIVNRYAKTHPIFTADMVFDYIFHKKIKFRKAMSKRRVGFFLSKSKQFKKTEKSGKIIYEVME